jgi:hypothetical protein
MISKVFSPDTLIRATAPIRGGVINETIQSNIRPP